MKQLVFLVEEPSMKEFLDGYLPRLLPGLDFLCLKHKGKQDLEKSIPRKLRAFQDADFVIVRDNDGARCLGTKKRLQKICRESGRPDTLIRLACQELEAWYLGSLNALAVAYSLPKITGLARKAKYRAPDRLGKPSSEVARLVPAFRKTDAARRMGQVMPLEDSDSGSPSFRVFLAGVRRWAAEAGYRPT